MAGNVLMTETEELTNLFIFLIHTFIHHRYLLSIYYAPILNLGLDLWDELGRQCLSLRETYISAGVWKGQDVKK